MEITVFQPARTYIYQPLGTRVAYILSVLMTGWLVVGCSGAKVDLNPKYTSPDRAEQGLVIILPGIEGESSLNRDIRKGLDEAGVPYSLAIYRWGFPVPGIGLVVNQVYQTGNRKAAAELAKLIVDYQQAYPGRPIYMIGHSGGGGIAVFALEALNEIPDAKPIDGAVLLSASISSDYDLSDALQMTQRGVVNVFHPDDKILLGTVIFGNVDGGHGSSAGRIGFDREYRNLYETKVSNAELGAYGAPHFLTASSELTAQYASAWIMSGSQPPEKYSVNPNNGLDHAESGTLWAALVRLVKTGS